MTTKKIITPKAVIGVRYYPTGFYSIEVESDNISDSFNAVNLLIKKMKGKKRLGGREYV